MRYKARWDMKGFVLVAATLGILAVAPPSAGAVIPPVTSSSLTIQASPNTITFGEATTISGKLSDSSSPGSAVTLEANPAPFTAGFQNVAATNADANGIYSFNRVAPTLNTRYRTITEGCVTICPLEAAVIPCPVLQSPLPCGGGTVSPELTVEVRIKVVLHVKATGHDRVRFYGTAAPAHDGLTVHIQRHKRTGKWTNVAHTSLKAGGPGLSSFNRTLVPRRGRYRARVDHDVDHADGTSHSRRIR
jgi:hypothetical protein